MSSCKYFWIKERHNPQLGTYFVACGKLPVKEAKRYETNCLYGDNYMHKFDNEEAYNSRLAELINQGARVH